jgi:SnoaL-like domain
MSSESRDQQLQALADRQALRDLAYRYARAIDRRDETLLVSLYHEDAIDCHGTVFQGGPKQYAEFQPVVMAQFAVTSHYIVNTAYAIDGDYAEGELYFIAYHRFQPPEKKELFIGGRYLDRYERRQGEWKFLRRDLVWDFARTITPTAEDLSLLASLGSLGGGRDDVSAAVLPLLAKSRRTG